MDATANLRKPSNIVDLLINGARTRDRLCMILIMQRAGRAEGSADLIKCLGLPRSACRLLSPHGASTISSGDAVKIIAILTAASMAGWSELAVACALMDRFCGRSGSNRNCLET
jgi:hypothetical protein